MNRARVAAALSPWERLYRPGREMFREPGPQFERAAVLVQVFQGVVLFHALNRFSNLPSVLQAPEMEPLWPVAWLTPALWPAAVTAMGAALVLTSVLSALFPFSRLARAATFLALFQIESVFNSYGKIDHDNHVLILVAFVFIWLPQIRRSSEDPPPESTQLRFLEVFWGAQTVVLLTYTLAGISKIRGASQAIVALDRSILSPDGMATILATDFLNTGKSTVLGIGEFIIAHPAMGAPMLVGAIALEFFSLPVAWTPRLHRLWGAGLIALHTGIALVMEVFFLNVLLVLGILLLASPFAPRTHLFDFRLRDLPWLGPFLSALLAEMRAQRRREPPTSAESALREFTLYFDARNPKQARWSQKLREDSRSAWFECLPRNSKEFQDLSRANPSLNKTDAIIAVSEDRHGVEIRTGIEATLWTAAHLQDSSRRFLFLVLLVPLPLLEVTEALFSHSKPASEPAAGAKDSRAK